jgi:hypothetical protein
MMETPLYLEEAPRRLLDGRVLCSILREGLSKSVMGC